jgi:hypothetical protein
MVDFLAVEIVVFLKLLPLIRECKPTKGFSTSNFTARHHFIALLSRLPKATYHPTK